MRAAAAHWLQALPIQLPVGWLRLQLRLRLRLRPRLRLRRLRTTKARGWEALGSPVFVAMAVVFFLMVNKLALAG